jgi:hypothetical protein
LRQECSKSIIHPVLFCFGIEVIFQKYGVLFTFLFQTIITHTFKTYVVRQVSKTTGKLNFKCKECDFDAGVKADKIKSHVLLRHFRVSPFECNQCDAHFKTNDYLRYHRKQHHGVELKPKKGSQIENMKAYFVLGEDGKPTNKCKTCDKEYTSVLYLQRHIKCKCLKKIEN